MDPDKPPMRYSIVPASLQDLNTIYDLFEAAILFQQQHQYIGWSQYDKQRIMADVESDLLMKVVDGENIVCIFSICYEDGLIWREKEQGNAVYLHRIVVNQVYKKEKMFPMILQWAIALVIQKKRRFIRMNTWANNEKLIAYYSRHGFAYIETYTTPHTTDLPLQHRNLMVALLQYDVQ